MRDFTGNNTTGNINNNNNNNNNSDNGNINPNSIFNALSSQDKTFDVSEYLINYNEKYKNDDPILYRDEVINEVLSILINKTKPNPILIGAAGVGKTKVVEDIARRLANDDDLIPESLKDYTIYELPISSIIAGSSFVGQKEEKMKNILEFIEKPENKAILFIDEIHQILSGKEYQDLAQMLKPAMARGDIRCITATTIQESSIIDKDPAFKRRLSKVIVDELTKQQTIKILEKIIPSYKKHYNNKIDIDKNLIPQIVEIAEEYHSSASNRPDNALTILDRTMSNAIITRKNQEIKTKDDKLIYNTLKNSNITLTAKMVKKTAIQMLTGNSKREDVDFKELETNIKSVIKGQDNAIDSMLYFMKKQQLNLFDNNKPTTLMFVGASGVGKTELTKMVAKEFTGTKPIILNMTEYENPASINKLLGAPPGYIGYDSKEEKEFDILETNPYQIIVLDEFEKCHPSVKTIFMQIFDEGFIKDNKGKILDFSKSIIIATTNATKRTKADTTQIGFRKSNSTNISIKELENEFEIALLNRFTEIITFQPISIDIYKEIVKNTYEKEITKIKDKNPRITLSDTLSEEDLNEIVKDFNPDFGARPVRRSVEKFIMNNII